MVICKYYVSHPTAPSVAKYKPRRRSGSTLVTRTESMSSTSDIFEAVPEQVSTSATYVIDFVGIGMSVIDKKLVEVLYVTIGDLKFEYATSPVTQSINLSCGTLQVDNQLHDALFFSCSATNTNSQKFSWCCTIANHSNLSYMAQRQW
jgi:vacuolar protein sorting-associated protein 13A/C